MMVAVDFSPCPYPQILRFNPAATTVRDIPAWANGPGLRCPPAAEGCRPGSSSARPDAWVGPTAL